MLETGPLVRELQMMKPIALNEGIWGSGDGSCPDERYVEHLLDLSYDLPWN
jgi:hypothetical protein